VRASGSIGGNVNGWVKGGLAVGGIALGGGVLRRFLNPEARYDVWERRPYREFEKKVLVVGGGFGGYAVVLELCKRLRNRDDVGVMMVAKENYFTFWPMVAGTISSDIDSINVAQPLRRALIQAGASFRRAELRSVDYENRTVTIDSGIRLPYDHLVLSLGAQPNFFGIPGVEEYCLTMKSIADAERIRNRVIERFEEATLHGGDVPDSRLTFVVIGGGATGVETAAELHELVTKALAPDYPNIDLDRVRIVLLNRGPEILTDLDPVLRRAARARLHSQNVEVMTGAAAAEIKADRVVLKDGREIFSENVIWTAGARPNMTCEHLGLPLTKRDGIKVDEYFRVEGHRQVWALGDCAAIPDRRTGDDKIIPPTAQAATQEGHALAKTLLAILDGREEDVRPFEYQPIGQLVELGDEFAVDEIMGMKISGLMAALLWRLTYLYKLQSPRSKALIATDWIFGLFFKPVAAEIRRDE